MDMAEFFAVSSAERRIAFLRISKWRSTVDEAIYSGEPDDLVVKRAVNVIVGHHNNRQIVGCAGEKLWREVQFSPIAPDVLLS